MEIMIKSIYPAKKEDSKVKAFCSVVIGDILINDIRLMEGKSGVFLSFPSKTVEYGGKERYIPYCEIVDKKLLQEVHHAVYTAYMEKV